MNRPLIRKVLRDYAREQIAPRRPDLWPAIRARVGPAGSAPTPRPSGRAAFSRRLLAGGVAGMALLLVLGMSALLVGGALNSLVSPLPVSTAAVTAPAANATDTSIGGLRSAYAIETRRYRNDGSSAFTEGRWEWWFQAPGNSRSESTFRTPDGQEVSTFVGTDAAARYVYVPEVKEFRIYPPLPLSGFAAKDLQEATAAVVRVGSTKAAYDVRMAGSEPVAGRMAYILELTIKPGLKNAYDVRIAQHRKRVWIDQQFFTLLGEQAWDAQDNLVWDMRVQEITINPPLDAALFTFTPPPGVVVADVRPASAEDRAAAWDAIAQQFALPLFVPGADPNWEILGKPYYDRTQGIVSQAFLQSAARGGGVTLVVRQGRPSAPGLAETDLGKNRPVPVHIGPDQGRLYYRDGVYSLVVDRAGTRILVYMYWTSNMSQAQQTLVGIVRSLQPVPIR